MLHLETYLSITCSAVAARSVVTKGDAGAGAGLVADDDDGDGAGSEHGVPQAGDHGGGSYPECANIVIGNFLAQGTIGESPSEMLLCADTRTDRAQPPCARQRQQDPRDRMRYHTGC